MHTDEQAKGLLDRYDDVSCGLVTLFRESEFCERLLGLAKADAELKGEEYKENFSLLVAFLGAGHEGFEGSN